MNAIQQYLTKVAQASIRQATGDLVRDGEVDPHLAVDSMNELLGVITHASSGFESKVPSTLVYGGRGNQTVMINSPNFQPMFFDPGPDREQG